MLPILNIGPLAIQTPGLIIVIGAWIAITIIEKTSKQYHLDSGKLSSIITWSLLGLLIFARVGYVAQYPAAFFANPGSIISTNIQLFDFQSGFVLAAILFFILLRRNKIDLSSALNAVTPGLIVWAAFFFLSLFASGEYYGLPSNLPWALYMFGVERHPLQLYYLIATIGLAFRVFYRLEKEEKPPALFWETVKIFSLIVIAFDSLRGDTLLMIGPVHMLQIAAFIFLILSIFFQKRKNLLTLAADTNSI